MTHDVMHIPNPTQRDSFTVNIAHLSIYRESPVVMLDSCYVVRVEFVCSRGAVERHRFFPAPACLSVQHQGLFVFTDRLAGRVCFLLVVQTVRFSEQSLRRQSSFITRHGLALLFYRYLISAGRRSFVHLANFNLVPS